MYELISIKRISNGLYELTYLDKKIYFCISICSKNRDTIENELIHIGLNRDEIQAIIPENLVKTPLQFIQALINHILYGSEFNVRNKGLLLSMLVIGEDQISEAVEILSRSYRESTRYYLLSISDSCRNIADQTCEPFIINDISQEWMHYKQLVKNLASLLKRL